MKTYLATLLIALTVVIVTVSCGGEPTPVPTPTAAALAVARAEPTPTQPPLPSPTLVPTYTPMPTATSQPTATPTHAATPVPTHTPTALPTATPVPTHTPTPLPTATPEPEPTPQHTHTQTGGDLPTTEVVRILAPSVVKIVNDLGAPDAPVVPFGLGTGVIIDSNGHILTNNHVVEGVDVVTVTLYDGETLDAEVVGRDRHTDLALIRIPVEGLQPALLGDSSSLLVGQDVIAIGHALGLGGAPTVSKGVVSALDRTIGTESGSTLVDLIQTDASINVGNSGGPLVNARAEVVGINTSILRFGQGIGFAVNINDAQIVADHLVEWGVVPRGYMGVLFSNLTPGFIAQLGLDRDAEGVLLTQVVPGSPAWNAGLRPADLILSANGEPMPTTGELLKFLMMHPPGESMEVLVLREGEQFTTSFTLGERPTN